jgi:hypothetical protein
MTATIARAVISLGKAFSTFLLRHGPLPADGLRPQPSCWPDRRPCAAPGMFAGKFARKFCAKVCEKVCEKVRMTWSDTLRGMGLGCLATIANVKPRSLTIIIWDNGFYQITGKQMAATGGATDIVAVARGAGIAKSEWVRAMKRISTR